MSGPHRPHDACHLGFLGTPVPRAHAPHGVFTRECSFSLAADRVRNTRRPLTTDYFTAERLNTALS
jgi:hypothetical protein